MQVAGTWTGEYLYNPIEGAPAVPPIPFSMTIQASWFGSFAGFAVDEFEQDVPNRALIQGRANRRSVRFRKTPQAFLTLGSKGVRPAWQFLHERLGVDLDADHPAPHILYQGQVDPTAGRMYGTWRISPHRIMLHKSCKVITFSEISGTWWALKLPGDAKPEGGA